MTGGKLHVLLIDDEPFMRRTVKLMLRDIAARVSEAQSGEQALEFLRGGEKPDVVLCDISMEPVDGIALLTQVRTSTDESLRKVPFVMLTAHSEQTKVAAAAKLGISGYLVKPVSPKQLAERLRVVAAA
jgi:two-component system chemotaxis response regulator CheY